MSFYTITRKAALFEAYFDISRLSTVFQATNRLTNADIVTDLYLKSLREFKPTAAKASDSEGQVKSWSAPAPPQAPESASNVESELSAYESSEVESASSGSSATASSENDGDWFELDTSPDRKCSGVLSNSSD